MITKKTILIYSSLLVSMVVAVTIYLFSYTPPEQLGEQSVEDNFVQDTNSPLVETNPATQDKESIRDTDADMSGELEQPRITRAEVTGENIRVAAVLIQPSSGECLLTFRNGEKTKEYRAPIIVSTTYYTCEGFLIPKDDITSLATGKWDVVVTHTYNNKSKSSDVQSIEID